MLTKEDYCSYEISRLLEEKGFHAPDLHGLDSSQGHLWVKVTHQMAMKWLREKGYHIVVFTDSPKYEVKIQDLNDGSFNVSDITHTYNTYEEAVEAAIKYCLTNLINNETN